MPCKALQTNQRPAQVTERAGSRGTNPAQQLRFGRSRWMSTPGNNHHRTRVASSGNKRRIKGCDCRYSHLSLSRIFPPHMVANMAFTENTVSFPWPSLRKTGQELIPGKRGNNTTRGPEGDAQTRSLNSQDPPNPSSTTFKQ